MAHKRHNEHDHNRDEYAQPGPAVEIYIRWSRAFHPHPGHHERSDAWEREERYEDSERHERIEQYTPFTNYPLDQPESQSNQQEKTMPVTLKVGDIVVATPVEVDANGANVAIVGSNITYAVSTLNASFIQNPDGTATFTGVSEGDASVVVSDVVNNLTFTDTITVTGGTVTNPPVSISLSWGEPVTPASGGGTSASSRPAASKASPSDKHVVK